MVDVIGRTWITDGMVAASGMVAVRWRTKFRLTIQLTILEGGFLSAPDPAKGLSICILNKSSPIVIGSP